MKWPISLLALMVVAAGGSRADALLARPEPAGNDTQAARDVARRIAHHREMAETRIHQHQAMTLAHVAGRTPVCPAADPLGAHATFFSPAFGEIPLKPDPHGQDSVALDELRMYWQRIPDFGIKSYEIYPSADGWAQVLYWNGTTADGQHMEAQEADIFRTDAQDRIIRVENYHDWTQWRTLAAFANRKDPAAFGKADYGAALMAQARSPGEICRPASLNRSGATGAPKRGG